MMKKVLIGLVVVVTAAGAIKLVSKDKNDTVKQEEIVQVESSDVSDHLYEDTFNDASADEKEEETVKKDDLDSIIESDLEKNEPQKEEEKNKPQKEEEKNTSSKPEETNNSTTGEFQGFADGNFIEVKVGDTYNVFKVTDAIKSKLQSKNMGDKITFTYVSSAGQNLITSIN